MGVIDGMDLGRFGVWTFDFEDQPATMMRESIQELEALGWQAFWIPERDGREAMTHAGFLLSCTERISVINGIARIAWATPKRTSTAAAAATGSSTTSCSGATSTRSSASCTTTSTPAPTTSASRFSELNPANRPCRDGGSWPRRCYPSEPPRRPRTPQAEG